MPYVVALFATACYGRRVILSDYERKDSPWIWIQFGASLADRRTLKTAIRKTDPQKKQKIARELNRIQAQLLSPQHGVAEGDWRWVSGYLRIRYASKPGTLRIYSAQWRALAAYLDEMEIDCPALLDRAGVFAYAGWRMEQVKEKSRRHPKLNTALGELKLLGLLMDEAVHRHLAVENPARKLNIEREESDVRPEILPAEREIIREALRKQPDWMQKSFEIALKTGLRFTTTRIARSQVRLASDDILIERPKGGRKREFTIPIYESIRPMITGFMKRRETHLWTAPTGTLTGLAWSKFLKALPINQGIVFHSTRITFITEGMRAGIPESVMMKMVNHARKEISRIYQRWTSDDVRRNADRLPIL